MAASGRKSLPAIGFVTVTEHQEHGLLGGYLLLNAAGRPLEFHCTAPVRPNRAQEILYGPTLKPFLYGEQIGQTLLAKARAEPLFVCTDVEPAMALREHVSVPIVFVFGDDQQPADDQPGRHDALLRLDAPHPSVAPPKSAPLLEFHLGPRKVAVQQAYHTDQQTVLDRWQTCAGELDLCEPFGRIRAAIEEAQRGAR